MNQETDDRFWSALGETLRPRLGEAQWAAQRARIRARLTPAPTGRPPLWATAGALACLAAAWLLMPQGKPPPVAVSTPAPAPASVQIAEWDARVTLAEGQVTIFSKGAAEGVPAAEGMPLEEGDSVRTGADGRAELALSTNSVIALGPASIITLSDLEPRQTLLNLDLGTMMAKLRWKGIPGRRMDVMTPTAVAAVRGTEFGVTVQEGGETSVAVFDEGKVAVRTKGNPAIEETMLEPRQEVLVPAGSAVETETREGRNYLRVGELSRLKPFREQIERIRERPEELSRSWKELDRPAREQVRSRMLQEHQSRMQALPPEERSTLQERLRRSDGGGNAGSDPRQGGRGQTPRQGGPGRASPQGGPGQAPRQGGGQAPRQAQPEAAPPRRTEHPGAPRDGERRQDRRGEDRGEDVERRPPADNNPRPSQDTDKRGNPRDDGAERPGPGRHPAGENEGREGTPGQERPGRPESENAPRPDNRFPREHRGLEQGQPPHEGLTPRQGEGPGRREHGPREEGGMRPPGGRPQRPGGEGRGQGGQQRERRGPGRERRH